MTEQETLLLNQFSKAGSPPVPAPAEETSLVDVVVLLLHRKKLIGALSLAATLLTAAVVFLLPPSYVAEASILPPQQQSSSLAAFASGAMGGLASGLGSQLGLKNPADMYVGILKSRTIADDIISRFHLKDVYDKEYLSEVRKTLASHAQFVVAKESLITISVKDRDPKRAAAIANAYVDELYKQNSRLALTDASQRRLFFEQQLSKEKDALADAEIALKAIQQSTGLLAPTGQAEVLLKSSAQFRAEIASRVVQLQAMRSFATEENPQVQILKNEIGALQSQLNTVEEKGSGSKLEMSGNKMPEATLEYIRKLRDLKYRETLFELIAKQYEAARIDEAKQAPLVQVVDRAVAPDRDSRPPKSLLIAVAAAFAVLLSSLGVVMAQGLSTMRAALRLRTSPAFSSSGSDA